MVAFVSDAVATSEADLRSVTGREGVVGSGGGGGEVARNGSASEACNLAALVAFGVFGLLRGGCVSGNRRAKYVVVKIHGANSCKIVGMWVGEATWVGGATWEDRRSSEVGGATV